MVLQLLEDQQAKILLDMGFGKEEQSRNEMVLNRAQASGIPIVRTDFSQLETVGTSARLVGIECSIGGDRQPDQ